MAGEIHAYAAVALNAPMDRLFHYRVPEPLREALTVGARVRVPFGRRQMTGYCVGFAESPDVAAERVKDILDVVDRPAILDERMIRLTRWMAEYYCCPWGKALDAVLPSVIKKGTAARTVLMASAARPAEELLARAAEVEARAPRQAQALRALARADGEIAAGELAEAGREALRRLCEAGYARLRKEKAPDAPRPMFHVEQSEPPVLTPDQEAALGRIRAALDRRRFQVALLHGVTGSGKTEVYLRTLQLCLAAGRQAIVLVPEIALTPQTVARFRGRFERVAVLHSDLSERERRAHWTAIREGQADVVIGTRSAVFAPVPNLGLLVVDEEHDASFKHVSGSRYNARDVGIWRAQQENALVILGSATPSLESLYNARSGKYELLQLPRRVEGRPLPPVELHDLKAELSRRGLPPVISQPLRLAMEGALARGEQIILFLNRRGLNTYLSCPRCGFVLRCKRCDVSLVLHRGKPDMARCHYCRYETAPPEACPGCGLQGIKYRGSGTERVEQEVSALFPGASVARMDSDSMNAKGSYERVLESFRAGKTQVLLGTQMLVKGLDFPNVTLVGMINADTSIHMPDFRASERTFQFIAQVAGRAGRGPKGGRVLVQTFSPDHPCVRDAARHDYEAFARRELEERRRYGYPPFARLARLLFEGRDARAVQARCSDAVAAVRAAGGAAVTVLGPSAAPIPRIKDRARWHALVKAPETRTLHAALAALDRRRAEGVELTVDVDPVSLL